MRDAMRSERAAGTLPGSSLFRGVLSLAFSATLLLIFPLLLWLTRSESWTPVFLLPLLVYPVLTLHVDGWVRLSQAARKGMVRSRLLPWSAVGFAIGVVTIPFVSPGWFVSPGGWQFLVLGMFAYLPTVLGPVVLAHAVLFFTLAKSLRHARASMLAIVGVVALAATSIGGVLYQITLVSSPILPESFFVLNGLAGFGYALVASGFRLESVDSRSIQRRSAT